MTWLPHMQDDMQFSLHNHTPTLIIFSYLSLEELTKHTVTMPAQSRSDCGLVAKGRREFLEVEGIGDHEGEKDVDEAEGESTKEDESDKELLGKWGRGDVTVANGRQSKGSAGEEGVAIGEPHVVPQKGEDRRGRSVV